jgi:hypothetical protein
MGASNTSGYFMECMPNMLPSVSKANAMWPSWPMDIFCLKMRPPAATHVPEAPDGGEKLRAEYRLVEIEGRFGGAGKIEIGADFCHLGFLRYV